MVGMLVVGSACGECGTNAGANATDTAADASDPIVELSGGDLLASRVPSSYAACDRIVGRRRRANGGVIASSPTSASTMLPGSGTTEPPESENARTGSLWP